MTLLSFTYAAFFALVLLAYWFLPGRRSRQVLLVAATTVWYFFGVWWHALVAVAMATTAWGTGRWIAARPPDRRGLPTLAGIVSLIAYFVVFRYLAVWTGHDPTHPETLPWWAPNPLLAPVGLSFLMFEGIAYQADLYLEREQVAGSWWSHLVFALYFPTRVIGPMRKYQDFTAQVGVPPRPTPAQVASGAARIAQGLLKKAILANPLGTFALFNLRPEIIDSASPIPSILGLYAYWVYLYLDFSGYSDIVIGLSRLLGIDIQENFDRPWLATNISEYWQRWHMSLSFWVREYVYTPLAIRWRAHVWGPPAGAFSSMVVLGMWHGLEARFIAFGVWHGLLLGGYMLYRDRFGRKRWAKRLSRSRAWNALGWVFVMNMAVWSHVFYGTTRFDVAMAWFRGAARIFGF